MKFHHLAILFTMFALQSSVGSPPGWWEERGAVDDTPPEDHAPASLGQLKHFTAKAIEELDARTFEGAGQTLRDRLLAWEDAHPHADDRTAVNLGQLKWVAFQIHTRLVEIGYENEFPAWLPDAPPVTPDPADHLVANIGQLKTVFNFDLSAPEDETPAWWEDYYFGDADFDPNADPDGDGWTNLQEYEHGTNPWAIDTDGDGIPDNTDPDPLKPQVEAGFTTFQILTVLE